MTILRRLEWPELLSRHAELTALPEELAELAWRQHLGRGERLFITGGPPRGMLFLLAGEVRLVRVSVDGSEVILQRIRRGFVAEASLNSATYHCDAVAASDGELLGFPIGPFRAALSTAAFRDFWIALLSGEVRSLRARCERLALTRTAERVIHYLQSEGREGVVTLAQAKKIWAAELGVSHESLYRTLALMRRTGRIAVDGQRVTLLPLASGSRSA